MPQQKSIAPVPPVTAWPERPSREQNLPLQSRAQESTRGSAKTLSRRDYDANIGKREDLLCVAVVDLGILKRLFFKTYKII